MSDKGGFFNDVTQGIYEAAMGVTTTTTLVDLVQDLRRSGSSIPSQERNSTAIDELPQVTVVDPTLEDFDSMDINKDGIVESSELEGMEGTDSLTEFLREHEQYISGLSNDSLWWENGITRFDHETFEKMRPGQQAAQRVYREMGEKSGSEIGRFFGMLVGACVGAELGGSSGAALAGPVGKVTGVIAGSIALGSAGHEAGDYVGGKIGTAAGDLSYRAQKDKIEEMLADDLLLTGEDQ